MDLTLCSVHATLYNRYSRMQYCGHAMISRQRRTYTKIKPTKGTLLYSIVLQLLSQLLLQSPLRRKAKTKVKLTGWIWATFVVAVLFFRIRQWIVWALSVWRAIHAQQNICSRLACRWASLNSIVFAYACRKTKHKAHCWISINVISAPTIISFHSLKCTHITEKHLKTHSEF